jgi:hypothetical protein
MDGYKQASALLIRGSQHQPSLKYFGDVDDWTSPAIRSLDTQASSDACFAGTVMGFGDCRSKNEIDDVFLPCPWAPLEGLIVCWAIHSF